MKILFAAVAAAVMCMATPVAAETLSNSDVVKLIEAGLGEEAVIAKIETEEGDFDTDVDTLLALREQGVPSAVIAAMVKKSNELPPLSDSSPDPSVPHFAGMYLMDEWSADARMLKIDPTASTQTKTGGIFGYALTGGIASASIKAVIPGEEARYTAQNRTPTFYMYLDSSAGNTPGAFSGGFGPSLQSPNELSLVRLKEKKERREARIGSLNIAGAKSGVMDKDQVPFSYETIGAGIFKISVNKPLKDGQYGFIFAVTGGAGPGANGVAGGARVFDFGVDAD